MSAAVAMSAPSPALASRRGNPPARVGLVCPRLSFGRNVIDGITFNKT